jgi:hypothetical protein
MDNLSTASSADFGSLIGALELSDHLASLDDGLLEAAGANVAVGPTAPHSGCLPPTFRCIGDDSLLRAADITMAGPITGQRWTGACCGR